MPTFTFEKISAAKSAAPPTMAVMTPQSGAKPRGVIIQLLDKLTESKMRRIANKYSVSFTEGDITPRR